MLRRAACSILTLFAEQNFIALISPKSWAILLIANIFCRRQPNDLAYLNFEKKLIMDKKFLTFSEIYSHCTVLCERREKERERSKWNSSSFATNVVNSSFAKSTNITSIIVMQTNTAVYKSSTAAVALIQMCSEVLHEVTEYY